MPRLPLALLTLVCSLAACAGGEGADSPATDVVMPKNALAAEAPSSETPGAASNAAAPTSKAAQDSVRNALLARADQARIKGDPKAKVWVIVISDYQCPYCKRWHDETEAQIENAYVKTGKVRMAYLNFPLSTHRNAWPAHEAAMCAAEQGKFWPMSEAIFASQGEWKNHGNAAAFFDDLAGKVGLARERQRGCIAAGQLRPLIQADYDRGMQAGVSSTPTFFIGDKAMMGAQPFAAFAAAIDAALAASATPSAGR